MQGFLALDRELDAIDGARKLGKNAVARTAKDPARVTRNHRINDRTTFVERIQGAFLVETHHFAESNHVGTEYGRMFSLHMCGMAVKAQARELGHERSAGAVNRIEFTLESVSSDSQQALRPVYGVIGWTPGTGLRGLEGASADLPRLGQEGWIPAGVAGRNAKPEVAQAPAG